MTISNLQQSGPQIQPLDNINYGQEPSDGLLLRAGSAWVRTAHDNLVRRNWGTKQPLAKTRKAEVCQYNNHEFHGDTGNTTTLIKPCNR